ADPTAPKWAHDAKALERTVLAEGGSVAAVAFDTMLAGYLLDPASATYPLPVLCERYLGVDVVGDAGEDEAGQLFAEDPWRATAGSSTSTRLPSCGRCCTTSSGCNPGSAPPRVPSRPTRRCWRSSAIPTRSSMRSCRGANSTSSIPPTSRPCPGWSIRVTVAC